MEGQPQPSLERQALGLPEAVIMGVAGTAPAFSIAATMSALVGAVGVLAPASLLYCGLTMFGTAFAFLYLSRRKPDAGAAFTWISDCFGPVLGFLAGWTLLVSSALFMVSGSIPAATATLALLAPASVDDNWTVTLVASGWLLVVGAIVLKGIKASSYVQIAMTLVEVAVICGLLLAALVFDSNRSAHEFSWGAMVGAGFDRTLFVSGALTALFFYWGWDVTANLNEETRGDGRLAGLAATISMLTVLAIFVLFAIVTLQLLSDEEVQAAGTNLVLGVARKLLPGRWADIAVIAVILSTIGTLETTILQFTRALFVMARRGIMPGRFAQLHRKFHTPLAATILMILLGLVLLTASSSLPSIAFIIRDSVNAIGVQAAFYYGLTSLASAWVEGHQLCTSPGRLFTGVAWPLLSAAALFAVAIYSLPTLDGTALVIGVGGILSGLVPLALRRYRL